MKRVVSRPWFNSLLALALAILLVVYINYNQTGFIPQGQRAQTVQTAIRRDTLNVPLQVSVDTDKYYVTGYPENVKVTLTGSNALVTSTLNTQNFRTYIDLTKFGVGKHKVKVGINGLSNQLKSAVAPAMVTVNIQPKKTRSLPVQIEYNKTAVASPYKIGTVKINPKVVNVTGSKQEVDRVDRIVARVTIPKGIKTSYSRQVVLSAVDANDHQLDVTIFPATANVVLPISLPHKKVKLNLTSHNENTHKSYSLTSDTQDVELYGEAVKLKKINQLELDVDLADVKKTTTKKVPLKLPAGIVKADPAVTNVKIKVAAGTGSNDAGSLKEN